MKTIFYRMLVLAAMLQHFACDAQQTGKDNIEGIWKGTSICQVKSSPCHDENVVCHISRTSATTWAIKMNKMVNGAEEEMGPPLDVVYNEAKQTLTGTTKDKQGRNDVWLFKIDGDQMHGTLTINENTLFRIIEVKK